MCYKDEIPFFVLYRFDYRNDNFALRMFLAGILPIMWFILLYLCTTMCVCFYLYVVEGVLILSPVCILRFNLPQNNF